MKDKILKLIQESNISEKEKTELASYLHKLRTYKESVEEDCIVTAEAYGHYLKPEEIGRAADEFISSYDYGEHDEFMLEIILNIISERGEG